MPLRSWRGREITAKAIAASQIAVDQTMAAAVTHAKENHGWQNQTGLLQGSIQIADAAQIMGLLVVGRWGSVNTSYAIFMEFLRGEVMGDTGGVRTRTGGAPYLRPAADAEYPAIRARLRAAFYSMP